MIGDKQKLQIVYACNDKMFYGLYLSILSIVKRTKNPINFFLLTGDLSDINQDYIPLSKVHEQTIKQMIKKYNLHSNFKVLDCKKEYLKRCGGKFPKDKIWPPYATFRLLLDMFKELKGVFLYLDTDTMACDNIKKAFNVKMLNYELCACHDVKIHDRRLRKTYFNSGVLLINLKKVRNTKYFEKAFKYMLEKNPKFVDQDALNWTWTKIKYWDDELRFNNMYNKRKLNTIIQHFCGNGYFKPKPWDKKFSKKYKRWNWIVWEDDINEFNQMKNNLKY